MVQKVTFDFVGSSVHKAPIRSCISCNRPFPISCNSWFVNALECLIRSLGRSLMSISTMLVGCGGDVDLYSGFLGSFGLSATFCFFHSRYSGGGRKRLLASSMEAGNGA